MATRWATSLTALLLVLSCAQSSVAENGYAENGYANNGQRAPIQNTLRVAQNNDPSAPPSKSPWEIIQQSIGQNSEKLLPAQPPNNPDRRPIQHVIPFAKPDPDAEILFKEEDGLISLSVRGGSLRRTISMIAEAQDLNIVFAAPADIGITASLEGVPWQQALDALLSASGFTWANSDGIIFVSSLETANFMSPGAGGRHTQIFELDFVAAVDVDQATKGLLSPGGRSWVSESSASDSRRSRESIVVFDFPTHLQRIEDYISQIDQPPRQVMIEANILQVELQDDRKNGVNFEAIISSGSKELKFSTLGFANAASSTAFFVEGTGSAITNLVEILQTTTDAKTLASPRLLVVSGQEAHIQIGQKLGYKVTTTTQTSSLESVQFLDVGVVLSVQPRITRDGRVLMRINPKVSTGQVIDDLPSEETTEVDTDILLSDGQGMVIGGLIQEEDRVVQSKIPWLGDLPYAGILFQKRQAVKTRSEIIVTLIPHVQPYSPSVACRDSVEFMRSQQRLTQGPLDRYPRPYEPRLPDALANPLPIPIANQRFIDQTGPANTDLYLLPTAGEQPTEEVELTVPASVRGGVPQRVWIDDTAK